MSHKTLSEAAAEVLAASHANAPAEGMHKEPSEEGSLANGEVNLGGGTPEQPDSGPVGLKASQARSKTNPPGVQPAADTKAPMHTLPTQPGQTDGRPTVSPQDLSGSQPEHNYMKPVKGGEKPTAGYEDSKDPHKSQLESVELTAEELEEAKKHKLEKMKEKMKAKSVKEDIDAILSGETFSEDFKTKLTTIFEGAVIARAVEVAEELEADILAAAEESVDEIKAELEEQVDSYLTVMVEEWKEENKLAIEAGLQTEIVGEFLEGLKNLFKEHYIEMPSEKVDVVEALTAEVAELTEKLNTSMNSNVALSKKINEAAQQRITSQVCEGLTATQASKVKTLAEGVEFTTEGEYASKLKMIRESYFNGTVKTTQPANVVALTEGTEVVHEEESSPLMDAYVAALGRTQ